MSGARRPGSCLHMNKRAGLFFPFQKVSTLLLTRSMATKVKNKAEKGIHTQKVGKTAHATGILAPKVDLFSAKHAQGCRHGCQCDGQASQRGLRGWVVSAGAVSSLFSPSLSTLISKHSGSQKGGPGRCSPSMGRERTGKKKEEQTNTPRWGWGR